MDGYELTERGKILVAILLVLLFLLIPSAIILYSAMSGGASPADGNEPQAAKVHVTKLSDISDDKTKSAIISAFAAFGIREQRLSSINNQNNSKDGPFEVYMSYNAYCCQ